MIFASKNEKGESKFDLILKLAPGELFDTRRSKLRRVGSVVSIQRGRGVKGERKAQIIACVSYDEIPHGWGIPFGRIPEKAEDEYKAEQAKQELFYTWEGLEKWFIDHKKDMRETYRITLKVF